MKPNSFHAVEYTKTLSERLRKYVPLLKEFMGITLFGYARIFFDKKSTIHVQSDPNFNETFQRHCQHIKVYYERLLQNSQGRYLMLWPSNMQHTVAELYRAHNHWNGAQFMIERSSHLEFFWVCGDLNNEKISDCYTSRSAALIRFFDHFTCENRDLLNSMQPKHLSMLEQGMDLSDIITIKKDSTENDYKIKKFLNSLSITLLNNLSPQEIRCVELLAQGRTMKEIGCTLNISPRTVESYIDNVKNKTGCHYKSEIIDLFYNNSQVIHQ